MPKGATADDAKRFEAEVTRSSIRSPNIPGEPLLVDVMGMYVDHAKTLRSPGTAKHHADRIGRWLLGHRVSDVRQCAAAAIRDMQPYYAPGTINRSLGTLKKALKLAWESGHVSTDYSGLVKRIPENNQRTVYMSLEHVKTLASFCTRPVQAAIWIALFTGMRRGEILKLKREDIGTDTITIQAGNTKTLKTRMVPIVSMVKPWLADVPLAITFEGLKTSFSRARVKAGLPHVTFHDLRRSCGTLMIQAGVSLHVVSKVLGHSSTTVTEQRYAHLKTEQMREGLELAFTPAITPAQGAKPKKPRK